MKKISKISFSALTLSTLVFAGCGGASSNESVFNINNPTCAQNYSQMDAASYSTLTNYNNDLKMKIKPESGDTIATIETNYGDLHALLYTKETPETTKNFIELAKSGKYDNTIFHRVIDCFMIQGGDFEKRNGTGGYTYKGPGTKMNDEFKGNENLKNVRGALSMANSGPNTNGSQFFVVQADYGTPWLDGKHTVFGFVYDGMGTVDKIAKVKKGDNDKPVDDVVVQKVTISQYDGK